jgi:hypothetical protein
MRSLSSSDSTVTAATPILRKDDTCIHSMAIDAPTPASNTDANADTDGTNVATMIRSGQMVGYKVYKRRWFGLAQLVLLNIIVSWDVGRLDFNVICMSCS